MLGVAELGNGSAVRKHPLVLGEAGALVAGCSSYLLDTIERLHPAAGCCSHSVCYPSDKAPILTTLQLTVADAWMFAAAACFKAADAGSDVTRY